MLKALAESPMTGDPDFMQQASADDESIRTMGKSAVRDVALAQLKKHFPDARAAGMYQVNFTHKGEKHFVRMTMNSVRLNGGHQFDISGTSRENAVKIIIAALKYGQL